VFIERREHLKWSLLLYAKEKGFFLSSQQTMKGIQIKKNKLQRLFLARSEAERKGDKVLCLCLCLSLSLSLEGRIKRSCNFSPKANEVLSILYFERRSPLI
jgi:hypothetical protein